MRDAYEVLYQKGADLVRVRQEVESLKVVAAMLADDRDKQDPSLDQEKKPPEPALTDQTEMPATGTDGLSSSPRQPSFWEFLKPARR